MKFIRSFPEMWASTRWPLSSSIANIVLGSGSTTVPSTSIASRLATGGCGSLSQHECRPGRADTRTHSVPETSYPWLAGRCPVARSVPAGSRICPSDRGEDLGAVVGDRDRVLEVHGERPVLGHDGPVVGEDGHV